LLASYYNAINRREYTRAWGYWENPPNHSYEDFVQGFADTDSVHLALHPPIWFEGAAGSAYTSIPLMLIATHMDGSLHNYVGCFTLRRPNMGDPSVEKTWSLFDATVHPTPGNSSDTLLLTEGCGPTLETSYDNMTSPVHLLASYYNAINLGEYTRAWGYWENPPNPTYEAFVDGFSDTEAVMLVVRPPLRYEGAVGNVYTSIPVLLSAEHTDGSQHNYMGCFVVRRTNVGEPEIEQTWWLFDATVLRTPSNKTDIKVLDRICETR
jgi:hypothetical protein